VSPKDKPLSWLRGEVKTPPFSKAARVETGFLLRRLQQGDKLTMPQSRPMPSIAARCHELRVSDEGRTVPLMYRIDTDAILILAVFCQEDREDSHEIIRACQNETEGRCEPQSESAS
jgi:hypothetical protein